MSASPQRVSGKHLGMPVANGLAPLKGPRSVIQSIDFSVVGTSPKTINFAESQSLGKIEFIQTLKIDNSLNPTSLSIFVGLTNDTITVPPYSMAYLPVLASKETPFFQVSTSGAVLVNIAFLSMALPALIWFPNGASGASPGVGTNYSVNQAAVGGNLILTIPAGSRNGVHIQNNAAQQIQVVLSNGSIVLLESGGADNTGGGSADFTDQGIVNVYSAEINAPVSAYVF